MRIDLHVHSSVSDGTDTPTQLVHKAQAAGLDVIGLTDHDTFDGIMEAQEASKRVGVKILPGVEVSTRRDGISIHLLGYGCDPWYRPLLMELAKIRVGRSGRLQAMADRVTEHGMPLAVEDIMAAAAASPSVGRPHVADAMVAKGYVANRQEAFDRWLGDDRPCYVRRYATPLEDAIQLVHDARGVAVLAHPWARQQAEALPAPYIEDLAHRLGLEGLEVEHPEHDEKTRDLLFALGARAGLVRTGSSDYHGLGKLNNPLGANLTRDTAYRDLVKKIGVRGGVV